MLDALEALSINACPKPSPPHTCQQQFNMLQREVSITINLQEGQMESIVSDNSLNFPTLQKASAAATECLFMSHVQNSECPA